MIVHRQIDCFIEYKQSTLLKAVYFSGDEISDEIVTIIEKNKILALSGVLGSKKGGTPVEYEEIKIKANGKWFVLEVYNRGLSIVYFETPELKRVFPNALAWYVIGRHLRFPTTKSANRHFAKQLLCSRIKA